MSIEQFIRDGLSSVHALGSEPTLEGVRKIIDDAIQFRSNFDSRGSGDALIPFLATVSTMQEDFLPKVCTQYTAKQAAYALAVFFVNLAEEIGLQLQ